MPPTPVFVTGNPNKLAEARRVTGLAIDSIELDLPEIQSLNVGPILLAKAEAAWQHVRRPVIVEETSLELTALNGFPGPLVKWMLEAVGAEGLARTAIQLGNPRAKVVCLLSYNDDGKMLGAWGECDGKLVLPARGSRGFGWDPVFVPDGHSRTFAEMSEDEKTEIGPRGKAWRHFLQLYSYLE